MESPHKGTNDDNDNDNEHAGTHRKSLILGPVSFLMACAILTLRSKKSATLAKSSSVKPRDVRAGLFWLLVGLLGFEMWQFVYVAFRHA